MNSSSLLIQERPLQVLPMLATAIGLNEAIVLQQIHYWLDINEKAGKNFEDGYYWSYNSYEAWQEANFPFWSVSTVKRVFTSLRKSGLIRAEQRRKKQHDRRTWVTICYDKLAEIEREIAGYEDMDGRMGQNGPNERSKMAQSTYTETTTEKLTAAGGDVPLRRFSVGDTVRAQSATNSVDFVGTVCGHNYANGWRYDIQPGDGSAVACGWPERDLTPAPGDGVQPPKFQRGDLVTHKKPYGELDAVVTHVNEYHAGDWWYSLDYDMDDPGRNVGTGPESELKRRRDPDAPVYEVTLKPTPDDSPPDPPDQDKPDDGSGDDKSKKRGKTKKPTPHVEMKNAIVAAFDWRPEDVVNWGVIDDTSKKLRSANVTPEEVQDLYKFTRLALPENSTFGPGALLNRVADWRKQRRKAQAQFSPADDFAPPSLKPTVTRRMEAASP